MSEYGVKDLLQRFQYLNEKILTYYQEDLDEGDYPYKIFQKIFTNNVSNPDTPEKVEFAEIKELIREIEKRSSSTDFVVGYLQDYGWREKTARKFVHAVVHSKF